jgi:hypothetical protein
MAARIAAGESFEHQRVDTFEHHPLYCARQQSSNYDLAERPLYQAIARLFQPVSGGLEWASWPMVSPVAIMV